MNFFYKETRKKQLHYFNNGKPQRFSFLNDIADGGLQQDQTALSSSPSKLFRFTALTTDLLGLNFVILVLLNALDLPKYITISPLIFVGNATWLFSAYITAVYIGRERFIARTLQAYMLFAVLSLLIIFLSKTDLSRLFVLFSFLGFAASLLISRTAFIGASSYIQNNLITSKFVVLGYNPLSHRLVSSLNDQHGQSRMLGFFDDYISGPKTSLYPVLGGLNDCVNYAIKNRITEIYSTISPETNPSIYEIAQEAEKNFIRFRFVPDFSVFINRRVHLSFVEELPVLSLRPEPLEDLGSRFKKRVFDIFFSSVVILFVLSWLVPILAILIKLDSKGPVFFKQLRSGKNNKAFLCFKFRSLTMNEDSDIKQVTRNDSRYTRLGKFLRKTNLDELPQFFNVFQGYMSVVGPRPHMLKHTEQYSEVIGQYMIRHFVKPGLTGLAQVNGYRGEIVEEDDLVKRVEHDIKYMENWSMLLDIQIILKTIYVSLKGDKNAF